MEGSFRAIRRRGISRRARLALRFWAGFDRQTIEIGGIEVLDYQSRVKLDDLPQTKVTYAGRAADAQWRTEALPGLKRSAKGIWISTSRMPAGRLLPAPRFTRCFAGMRSVSGRAWMWIFYSRTPDAVRYRQTILSLFNRAVFENEMKWQATWNGVPPDVDRALALAARA